MYRRFYGFPALLLILIMTLQLLACAAIRIVPIPAPSATTKIRVYVQPFTTVHVGKRDWGSSHEDFVNQQVRLIEKYMAQTGIYEIVSKEDVRAVIGDQSINRFRMELNDWAIAKKIGGALHADYIMIMERGTDISRKDKEKYFFNALINVQTGTKFGVEYSIARRRIQGQMNEIIHASYRDIFMSAKNDLLATTIRKGQHISSPTQNATSQLRTAPPAAKPKEGQQISKTTTSDQSPLEKQITKGSAVSDTPSKATPPVTQLGQEQRLTVPPVRSSVPEKTIQPLPTTETRPPVATVPSEQATMRPKAAPPILTPQEQEQRHTVPLVQSSVPEKTIQPLSATGTRPPVASTGQLEQDWLKIRDVEDVLTENEPITQGKKLVVYDLDASEQFKTAALILSESLREEIFRLRKFILVNRENIDMVLKEMALQQTGLINEKEAVKMGKGFAANQVVTGRFGFFGKTYVLQAKRIEVETFMTLGFATARFAQGQEDDAFVKMREFATLLAEQ